MKKIALITSILLICILLIFYGKGINNSFVKKNQLLKNAFERDIKSKIEFYNIEVPDNFINTTEDFVDLRAFYNILNNNVYISDDKDFNEIWSTYFLDKHNVRLNNLLKCINGKINTNELTGLDRDICIGENKFIIGENTNFFHIKDQLLKYKNIFKGGSFNCNYFLENNYNIKDKRPFISFKRNDYLICKYLQSKDDNIVKKETFYYKMATKRKLCKYLNNENLIKLCNEEVKLFEEESKKIKN